MPNSAPPASNYSTLATWHAARQHLAGWNGLAVPFARQGGLVTEDALSRVPEVYLSMVAQKIEDLRWLTKDQEKNSA